MSFCVACGNKMRKLPGYHWTPYGGANSGFMMRCVKCKLQVSYIRGAIQGLTKKSKRKLIKKIRLTK